MRRSGSGTVAIFVEPESHLRSFDEDRASDQVGVLHHEIDRFFLRFRERPFLEHGASRADEVEKPARVDVLLEKLTRRRIAIDVDLVDLESGFVQKTSGVFACGSGGLPIERRFRHIDTIIKGRLGCVGSACGPSEAPEGSPEEPGRRARARGGGAPRA